MGKHPGALDVAAHAAAEAAAAHFGVELVPGSDAHKQAVAAVRRNLRGYLPEYDEHDTGDLEADLEHLADSARADRWHMNFGWVSSVARRANRELHALRYAIAVRMFACCGDPYSGKPCCSRCTQDYTHLAAFDIERARDNPNLPTPDEFAGEPAWG